MGVTSKPVRPLCAERAHLNQRSGPTVGFLSVCYLKAEFRGAYFDISGKIVEVRHKMMFREQ